MSSPTFAYDYKAWATVAEFEKYLAALPAVSWAEGVTIHHTYSPTLVQWHKTTPRKQLDGLAHYYQYEVDEGVGWSAGPHLFIADDGIYQLTPLSEKGVHATICNSHFWGCEVVGDYNDHYWSAATEYNVIGVAAALLRKAQVYNVSVTTLKGHRECNSPKTCPGTAISMSVVRQKVRDHMGIISKPPIPVPAPAKDRIVIGIQQSATYEQWSKYMLANGVRMLDPELRFIYATCERLQVDAAFITAMAKQESFEDDPTDDKGVVAVMGGGTLQRQTRNPLNITEPADSSRDKVSYNGRFWRQWESWQLGYLDAILYIKQKHGAHGRLTVRAIIPVHAPSSDGNNVEVYIANVLKRMDDMKAL